MNNKYWLTGNIGYI